jgi:tyrosyl-tRNA synthetase
MADRAINESVARSSAEGLHRYAHLLVKELQEDGEKIFAVSAAGHAYVGDKDINAQRLFDVIREVTEDVTVQTALQNVIDELAKRAGSSLTREQAEADNDQL